MRARNLPLVDQSYPEHWLAQVPVPDRSAALRDTRSGAHQPLEPLLQAMGRLAALGTQAVAIACNTAHAWHASLQQRFPQMDVLHGVQEVAADLVGRGVTDVGLLATQGTYDSALYTDELEAWGVRCHVPSPAERELLMTGIYQGVKADNLALARQCFTDVAQALQQRHGLSVLIMGCTEIPLALQRVPPTDGVELLDPARVLARTLVQRAYTS